MWPTGSVRVVVRSFGAPFTVAVDGTAVQLSGSGEAQLELPVGTHELALSARGTPGMPLEIEVWSPGDDPWSKSVEFSPRGVIALSHSFSVGGTDWTGPRA